jgi:hypothetical protein
MHKIDVNKYIKVASPPRPINVPNTVSIYTIKAGTPFVSDAAKIAIANGAIPTYTFYCRN